MTSKVEKKLKKLPKKPGVYFHKNAKGEILYVGKAAILANRVRQYFAPSRIHDAKTDALVAEIADIEWIEVDSEIDALFLEAELIRRYMPPYNILLRDDKSYVYVRVNYDALHPTVTLTRRPLDDRSKYFGPFASAFSVKRALKFLRRAFPYSTHDREIPKRACLQFHLGLCPGLEENKTSLNDYRANLKKLMQFLSGKRTQLMRRLEKDMKLFSKEAKYEQAAAVRDQLETLKRLTHQVIFGDREFMDISKDHALRELAELLGLYDETPQGSHSDGMQGAGEQQTEAYKQYVEGVAQPATQQTAERTPRVSGSAGKPGRTLRMLRRIEGFDISHMGGKDTTASMVVFASGIPYKTAYRKFKMRLPGNDDFAHMHEVISRRLSEKNRKDWGTPDLILVDGGKGQLGAAVKARNELGLSIPMIGLAKRFETLIIQQNPPLQGLSLKKGKMLYSMVNLPLSSHVVKLLQRIRDESHRFAVSYHTVLKTKRQTIGLLDEIPTIGPATRKKLLKTFGSLKGITQARHMELEKTIGSNKAEILRQYLRAADSDKPPLI